MTTLLIYGALLVAVFVLGAVVAFVYIIMADDDYKSGTHRKK
jgi:uncharacterized protein involved in exopolysaccharide biosynthesis